MNIESIGLENFRLVKNNFFDLSSFVVLTGANNSGKSTLLKALLLISKSFKKFPLLDNIDLKGVNPNLGSFENIISEKSRQKYIAVTLPFEFIIAKLHTVEQLQIKFTFSNIDSKNKYYPELVKLEIFDKENLQILNVKNRKIVSLEEPEKEPSLSVNEQLLFFNFEWYREKFKKILEIRKEKPNFFQRKLTYDDSNLRFYINEIELLLNSGEYFSDFTKIKTITHKVAYGWLIQERDFKNGKKDRYSFTESLSWFFEECFPYTKLKKINSSIGQDEDWSDNKLYQGAEGLLKQIKEDLFHSISNLNQKFAQRISYLEAYRGSIDRLYTNNNENFNQLLSEYIEVELSSKEPESIFLTKWINNKKFNFGGYNSFEIIPYSEFNANVVKLKRRKIDKEGKALADFGYGTLQVFTILLKIILEAKKNRSNRYKTDYTSHTILIEEPEANLHPKWQALLADMLIDAIKTFNTQFVVETHSEYLIRRLQYLVANSIIESSKVKFFNFKDKSQITEIKIDDLGNIKTELGVDFFDEATTLKDELDKVQKMKELQNENQNLNAKLKSIDGSNRCVLFTEDDKISLLKHVLEASGFNLEETEIYSYQGCSNLSSAKLISKYINKKFPKQKIVIHRDQDYLSLEEIKNWKEDLDKINIYPFITKGTEVEYYYLNPDHINKIHNEISIIKATEILDVIIKEIKETSITNMKKHEFGDRYKKKKSDLFKYIEIMYIENPIRYTDSKKAFSKLKQKIKDETKENAKISRFSNFLKDENLEKVAFKIWGKPKLKI